MPIDLTACIDCEDVDHLSIAIHSEQNTPAANPGLADSGPVGERGGQPRIERVVCKLHKASAETLLRRAV
jgi:hypothetical protein